MITIKSKNFIFLATVYYHIFLFYCRDSTSSVLHIIKIYLILCPGKYSKDPAVTTQNNQKYLKSKGF